ncbi:MAG: 3-phosphoshikimate 1-carboxyvinyltransferase [Bacteroidota bacterium]|nr:3-phosphoshikimate 1-carboxyvinyltransferase [Bacteroidota bacterium]
MPNAYRISCPQPKLSGSVILEPSKSISNRVLLIQSLCKEEIKINRLSKSDDTEALAKMLSTSSEVLYSGHAGSSYRFMVARACLGDKTITLDASEQLRKRPIGTLVKALQTLGADIQFLNKEGFPPLLITPTPDLGKNIHEINLQAGVSSQFVSALLLIAPVLPQGLKINLINDPVSIPYIRMTLEVMKYFGVDYDWTDNTITIPHGDYKGREYSVEGDWSAAAYYYSIAALSQEADINIEGVSENSLQGDAAVAEIYQHFNVTTAYTENGIHIHKKENIVRPKEVRLDFIENPDLAQTVMVTLSGLGAKGVLTGLQTLKIKETDRILAMQTELARVKTFLDEKEEGGKPLYILHGRAKWKDKAKFNTYDDHRMAMAFAPLACLNPIMVREPEVVTKSYPGFWHDLKKLGFVVEKYKG